MLVYPIAAIIFGTTLSAEAASSTTQPKRKTPTKTDFLKAMDRHARNNSKRRALKSNTQDEFNAEIYGSTKSSAALRKKIIAKSVPAASSSSGGNVGSAVGGGNMKKGGDSRNLGYYYQNKYSQENDGSDDYFNIGTMNAFGFGKYRLNCGFICWLCRWYGMATLYIDMISNTHTHDMFFSLLSGILYTNRSNRILSILRPLCLR